MATYKDFSLEGQEVISHIGHLKCHTITNLVYEGCMPQVPEFVSVIVHQMSPEFHVCRFFEKVVKDDLHAYAVYLKDP
jgi:hypothetical protein